MGAKQRERIIVRDRNIVDKLGRTLASTVTSVRDVRVPDSLPILMYVDISRFRSLLAYQNKSTLEPPISKVLGSIRIMYTYPSTSSRDSDPHSQPKSVLTHSCYLPRANDMRQGAHAEGIRGH
jgi:hypothetical protein